MWWNTLCTLLGQSEPQTSQPTSISDDETVTAPRAEVPNFQEDTTLTSEMHQVGLENIEEELVQKESQEDDTTLIFQMDQNFEIALENVNEELMHRESRDRRFLIPNPEDLDVQKRSVYKVENDKDAMVYLE